MKVGKTPSNLLAALFGPALLKFNHAPVEVGNLVINGKEQTIDNTVWASQVRNGGLMAAGTNTGYPTSPLAKLVSEEWLSKHSGHAPDMNIFFNDASAEIVKLSGGKYATVTTQVNDGVGPALQQVGNWAQTAAKVEYVDIKVVRRSRPFSYQMNDAANGLFPMGLAAEAVHAVVMAAWQDAYSTINAGVVAGTVGLVEAQLSTMTQPWAKNNLAGVLGAYGRIENTLLTYDAWLKLMPDDVRGFGVTPTAGFQHLFLGGLYNASTVNDAATNNTGLSFAHTVDGAGATKDYVPTVDVGNTGAITWPADRTAKALGFVAQRRALKMVARLPLINSVDGISVSSLGVIGGIPLLLKTWVGADTETMWSSVEAATGTVLTVPEAMRVITTATVPAA